MKRSRSDDEDSLKNQDEEEEGTDGSGEDEEAGEDRDDQDSKQSATPDETQKDTEKWIKTSSLINSFQTQQEIFRILILPSNFTQSDESLQLFQLPHPRLSTGPTSFQCSLYGFRTLEKENQLFEISRAESNYLSWFAWDTHVIGDNGLYFATPSDPLFIFLPFLDWARFKNNSPQSTNASPSSAPTSFESLPPLEFDFDKSSSTPTETKKRVGAFSPFEEIFPSTFEIKNFRQVQSPTAKLFTGDDAKDFEDRKPSKRIHDPFEEDGGDSDGDDERGDDNQEFQIKQRILRLLKDFQSELTLICDVIEDPIKNDGSFLYRLNNDRVVKWLAFKVFKVMTTLHRSFNRRNSASELIGTRPIASEAFLKAASHLVSDNLNKRWQTALSNFFGMMDQEYNTFPGVMEANQDTREGLTAIKKEEKEKAIPKGILSSAATKKKAKIEVKGPDKDKAKAKAKLKPLTSFFSSSPKKPS